MHPWGKRPSKQGGRERSLGGGLAPVILLWPQRFDSQAHFHCTAERLGFREGMIALPRVPGQLRKWLGG